ncbi:MAG: OsmC family protein [Alphaproteobacteria bacterium]
MSAPLPVTISENHNAPYGQTIRTGPHVYTADEPETLGGRNTGPTPIEHLMAALGGCTLATLRMYLRKKNIPLGAMSLTVTKTDGQPAFHKVLTIQGGVPAEVEPKLHEVAEKCPVQKMLAAGCTITMEVR